MQKNSCDGIVTAAHVPSSFRPSWENSWMAIYVLPLFLLCFLFLKYSNDQGLFQGIMLRQETVF